MTASDSLSNAKAAFAAAVAQGIDALMVKCGYSRERATATLLRELTRGDSTPPSDEEIFLAMKRLGLGIEETTRTLVVGKALRRILESESPEKAIEQLAAKIAVGNLMYDSSDEHEVPETQRLIIRADLRVEPVSRQGVPVLRKGTPTKKGKSSGNKQRARKAPSKSAVAGRKRSVEEMASSSKTESQSFPNRPRADSVSEEVSAKIAKQSASDESAAATVDTTARTTSAGVRTKRVHRSEPADKIVSTCNKRIRGNEE